MARIRTIKPDYYKSLDTADWSLLAFALGPGLLCVCDDEGRAIADPRLLAAELGPIRSDVTEESVADCLQEWDDSGFIQLYQVDGRPYLQVCKWDDHQRINRPTDSKLPAPSAADTEPSPSAHAQLSESSVSVPEGLTDGKEGNREGNREHDLGGDAAVVTVDIDGFDVPFPVKAPDLTSRIIKWVESEGLEEPKGWRDPPESADVALRGVAQVLGEGTDATKAAQKVCVELICAVTGEDVPQPTWGHLGRLVTTQDKRLLAAALTTALEAGAGLTEGYVDDPLALTKYATAVLRKDAA